MSLYLKRIVEEGNTNKNTLLEMLPVNGTYTNGGRWRNQIPEFIRRAMHLDQMELDSALSQMWQCVTYPSIVAKISKARKVTKNYYHRDDPAFVVLLSVFIVVVCIAFGITTQTRVTAVIANIISSVVLYFLGFGFIAATVTWAYANRFLMGSGHLHEVRKEVEWQYAFDIHCNSFCAYFAYTGVLHFFLFPVLIHDSFFTRLLSNSLYGIGVAAYMYNTFRGYLELPMLTNQQVFMYPIMGVVVLGLLATITHVSMTHFVIHQWWSPH